MTAAELREARHKLGLTARELGDRLGRDMRTIYRYESGEKAVPKLVALAVAAMMKEETNDQTRL